MIHFFNPIFATLCGILFDSILVYFSIEIYNAGFQTRTILTQKAKSYSPH